MDSNQLVEERLLGFIKYLASLHLQWGFSAVVIELPETRQDGVGVRASQSGAMAKLNFAVGAIWQWARCTVLGPVLLVPVSKWKGQLPKEVMLRRLQKRGLCLGLRPTAKDMNESDAVALLDWAVNR